MRSTGVHLGRKTLCRKELDRVERGRMFGRLYLRLLQNVRFTLVPECSKDIIYVREHKLRRGNCVAS